jgi:hypothetical protein
VVPLAPHHEPAIQNSSRAIQNPARSIPNIVTAIPGWDCRLKIRGSSTANYIITAPSCDLAILKSDFALQNAVQPILFSVPAVHGNTETASAT